jgi:hypothetical protein
LTGNTANVAVGAQVNITFDANVLDFFGQFASSQCTVNTCLGTNDIIIGGPIGPSPGVLKLGVSPNPAVFPEVPFPAACTSLASCNFHIKVGVPTGTTALALSSPILTNSTGMHLEVTTADGAIIIAEATPTFTPTVTPTPHATATNTPVPPPHTSTATPINTATRTNSPTGGATHTPTTTPTGSPTNTGGMTPTNTAVTTAVTTATATSTGGTPTVTPSAKATSTNTVAATRTTGNLHPKDGDSCSIVAPEQSSFTGTLALLLAPAVLVWARRRRF